MRRFELTQRRTAFPKGAKARTWVEFPESDLA